jgi:general secretion pathway protein G
MKRRGRIKLLLLILLAALVGEFFNSRFISRQKRELSLKADLRLMRQAIDNYPFHGHAPATTLQDLTSRHYLKKIPTDSFTQKEDWVPLFRDVAVAPEQMANGIAYVHSASGEIASNGTAYNTW